MSLPMEEHEVILGVDTHLDVHVAVLIDEIGRVVATHSFPTTARGYEQLIEWAGSFGRLSRAGVEGTGTYGAGLARRLQERGVKVLEINRPDRSRRRLRGKSDPTDAENAARAVLAGDANAIPKAQCGVVEAMRAVTMARRSAVKAKTQAINQLRALLVTAPEGDPCRALESQTGTLYRPMRAAAVTWRHTAAQRIDRHAAPARKTVVELGERAARAGLCVRAAHQTRRPPTSCTIRRRPANSCHVVSNSG
jgi:transposase